MLFLRFCLPKMLEGRDQLSLVRGVLLLLDRGVSGMLRNGEGSGVLGADFESLVSALICS